MFGLDSTKYKKAYTLAEVLLVLIILSLMIMAVPPIMKKTFKVKNIEKKHGRFECFYDNTGALIQYELVEGNRGIYKTVNTADGCVFYPPSNTTYIMIHSVGGGGAGYSDIGSIVPNNSTSDQVARTLVKDSTLSNVPEWFKYVREHYPNNIKNASSHSNSYELKKYYRKVDLEYGLNGQPGERISMIFPSLPSNVKITMKPGLGAVSDSTDGSDTNVYFRYPSSESDTLVINAKGGASGTTSVPYSSALYGGPATDFGVGDFQSVKFQSSKFEDILESSSSNQITMVNRNGVIPAGWGGNGSYFYLNSNFSVPGSYQYSVSNYLISNSDNDYSAKYDFWTDVSALVAPNVYNRNNETSNCSVQSTSTLYVSGSCYKPDNYAEYKCNIKNGNIAGYTYWGLSGCNPNTNTCLIISPTQAAQINSFGPFVGCNFYEDTAEVRCVQVKDFPALPQKHNCSWVANSDFTCPDGITADRSHTANGWGVCEANGGGNGAVVILW